MKLIKKLLIHYVMLLFMLFPLLTVAQKTVTGTVTDAVNKTAVEGATILVKGQKTGTKTDANGKFSIDASSGQTLIISFVGFKNSEIKVGTTNTLAITLEPGENRLDEVVVVGYGQQRKSSLTASIASIKGEEISRQPVGDLTNSIGGRVAGVLFTQNSGLPGHDAASILIRGVSTIGNTQPLVIVDGVPRNFSQLNPNDIESISVLKDASAVAPYGMAGANGVILVTSKKGKIGPPSLTYDGYAGSQAPTVITRYVNSYQYALMKNAAADNEGNPRPYSEIDIQKYRDGTDPDGHPNTDPINDMIKKNTFQTSHSLSLLGGTEKIRYAMGLGYYYQEGMFPGINYKRYNMSASLDAQATKTTKVALSIIGRVENRNLGADNGPDNNFLHNRLFEALIRVLPNQPIRFSNGLPTAIYAKYYHNESNTRITGNTLLNQLSLEQQLPLKGLSVKAVVSYDWNPVNPFNISNGSAPIESFSRTWSVPYISYTVDTTKNPYEYIKFTPTSKASFSQSYSQAQAFTYQGFINYSGSFGKHSVGGLFVLEARNLKASTFSAGRTNYSINIPELFAGSSTSTDITNTGISLETKQRSLVYRLTYGFDSKYLIEVAGRYDGHYYFAPGNRYGFFPAFSAAWRLSEEKFMKDIAWINNLKIRASYGESGQLAGAPFQYLSAYGLYGNAAVLNGTSTQGLFENSEPNPSITWEKARKTNIGLEANLWNGLLTVEADYFYEKRNNMLVSPAVIVPIEYGIGLSQVNQGVMSTRGIEFTLGSNHNFSKDLSAGMNVNFTLARNKLEQVFETSTTYDNPNRRRTGKAFNTPFGYQALGYFSPDDFEANGDLKSGIATQPWGRVFPGDLRYADLSGPAGRPDGKIDPNDEAAMGDPTYPAIVYAFSPSVAYKNFELSLLFQGAAERSIQLTVDAAWAFFNGGNANINTLDYWTPDNTDAPNPRITSAPTLNNTQTSTWWQRNTSYLRLRTGLISYTLPKNVTNFLNINKVRIYVSGQNIFTWSPLKNYDPETSERGWYYSTQKAITLGLNVGF